MEFTAKIGDPGKQRTACLVLGVFDNHKLTPAAAQFDAAHDSYLTAILRTGDLEGKVGQSLLLRQIPNARCERVLLVGCGAEAELDDRRFRQIIQHTYDALVKTNAADMLMTLSQLPVKARDNHWKIRQIVEGIEAAHYRFSRLKSKPDVTRRTLAKVILAIADRAGVSDAANAIAEGAAVAAGVALAKDLGNLPANICTPTYLAEQAHTLAAAHKKLRITVLDQAEMEKLGMRALLAVARGSAEAPRFIVLEYRNGSPKNKPYALVGKGITFDTGGISIKPSAAMDEMKFDMCGAASVLGTLQACAQLDLPLNVVGVVAAVENMPDGKAVKPGDIVTSLSGQTVEILNTDAEGRLILCDALTYCERYEPETVIDIATLTGACVVALGNHPHGLFSNDDTLASELNAAGEQAGDRCWRLPLWEDYQEALDSNFADMANVGGREGGAITAACFLWRFTKKLRWAHLDIAGTAWKTGKSKGATGRPVALLAQYLFDRAADATR
ncbi:MAG: leucyl aminopeptidase [Gammaproteobacteria bacterium]